MPSTKVTLKGITWNHSRGFVPMVATAQRFSELNPSVEIIWEKRSLQQFADLSIDKLATKYDLLVIDHPWAGFAAKTKSILPLNGYLDQDFLEDQKQNTVGHSFESYTFNDQQWALAVDAATPVASSRPDLMEKLGIALPDNFNDLIALANDGYVAFPAIPIDTLMHFYMFCSSLGEDPCQAEDRVVSEATGRQALQLLKILAGKINPDCFNWNPIQLYEAMTSTDEIAYCPFAYGYSNYSRNGYARKTLHFHDIITLYGEDRCRSTLGGTGLAVSSSCKHIDQAIDYVTYVASGVCQNTVYFENGGQPGHLKAWKDEHVNYQTRNYFSSTLPALQRAFLRPRYHGHMYFQDNAGEPIREYMMHGGDETDLLKHLNELYIKSRSIDE
jgi:multiple sugar transport system substrate-binding protein